MGADLQRYVRDVQEGVQGCCHLSEVQAVQDFVESHGSLKLAPALLFGRARAVTSADSDNTTSQCHCRYCGEDDATPQRQPAAVTSSSSSSTSASLCFSSFPLEHFEAAFRCHAKLEAISAQVVRDCLRPDRSTTSGLPRNVLFVLGDSHAAYDALVPLTLAVRGRFQVRHLSVSACGLVHTGGPPYAHPPNGCLTAERKALHAELRREVLAVLKQEAEIGDVLALAEYRDAYALEDAASTELGEFRDALPKDAHLLLLGDTPGCNAPTPDNHAETVPYLQAFAKQHGPTSVIDLHGLFDLPTNDSKISGHGRKHVQVCPIPGTQVSAYVDSHHLAPNAAIYLWPFLCDAMVLEGIL